ncbi:MAG: potassium-transporting ATPase subunit C [Fimbriiglobus sp.]|jgi:K+-transporting ATPase ATPase C chain|nr:potassium-transporting ATPase subunit C [Fimbriiglobus sp.]
MKFLRANLILTAASLAICCVFYPAALWAVGQGLFPSNANGSLVTAPDGRMVGSSQVAQGFTADHYFWSRPSAAGYDAAATGGSNWGANNPKLRDRAARQLGPLVRYKAGSRSAAGGRTPQADMAAWFGREPDRASAWAGEYTVAAAAWAKDGADGDTPGPNGAYVLAWAKDHPEVLTDWQKGHPSADPKPEDVVAPFFASFAKAHPGQWPSGVEGNGQKRVEPATASPEVAGWVFDLWLQDPANRDKVADLQPVPADMVTASGAGLDPHITLRNALSVYQLGRVAATRGVPADRLAAVVDELSFTPLSGLTGEPLVNVLELNLELDRRFPRQP